MIRHPFGSKPRRLAVVPQEPTAMSDRPPAPIAPRHGAEFAVPWPTPPIPGTALVTFWGSGDATSEPFTLPGDASVRIAAETGPFALRVLNPDGTTCERPGGGASPWCSRRPSPRRDPKPAGSSGATFPSCGGSSRARHFTAVTGRFRHS
jgi:hypothetical protein